MKLDSRYKPEAELLNIDDRMEQLFDGLCSIIAVS